MQETLIKGILWFVVMGTSLICAILAFKYSKKNSFWLPPHQSAATAAAAVLLLAIVIVKFLYQMGWYFD